MAQFHGKDGVVKVGGNAVAEVTSWSFENTAETYQTNEPTMTDPAPALTFVGGATSGSGSIECKWDDTDTTGQGALNVGATVSLTLYPEGDTSGDFEYSFSAVVTSASVNDSVDAINTHSFSFQISGAITEGTVI